MSSLAPTSEPGDPAYPLYPACAGLGIILILLPAYWQFKSGNVGTISYIVWIAVANLNALVNAISWNRNLHEPPWLWCDISTAFTIALNVALPTSSFLITRRLYQIASIRQVILSDAKSRRAKYWEVAMAIGFPGLALALRVIVQGHRFNIIENYGCWPSVQVTPVAIALVWTPSIIINLASTVYSCLVVRIFWNQRRRIREILGSPGSIDRYFRLMALSATEIICCLPSTIYVLVANVRTGVLPWISWNETHSNFNRIDFYPASWFQSPGGKETQIGMLLYRYSIPGAAFIFFLFFGMVGDSGTFYGQQSRKLAAWFNLVTSRSEAGHSGSRLFQPPAIAISRRQSLETYQIALERKKGSFSMESLDGVADESAASQSVSIAPCIHDAKDLDPEMGRPPQQPPPIMLRSSLGV